MADDFVQPYRDPALYPTGKLDANDIQSHIVSRPDLVRIDDDGKVTEIATLVVNGKIYEDWETVFIRWSWGEQFSEFKFSCAEREPYPLPGQVLQFAPGNNVDIYLGGIQVISGVIITRQVAYDANQHVVELQGVSASWFASQSSIDDKSGDYNGMSFTQIATKILGPTGVGWVPKGDIDNTPFESGATRSGGETIGQFLDRLARLRKILVTNLPDGRYQFVGDHTQPSLGELVEGINIKKMQCVISIEGAKNEYVVKGNAKGNDQKNQAEVSEQEARIPGAMPRYNKLITTMENPVWTTAELVTRAKTEKMWNEDMTKIDATVTVYGWFRPLPTVIQSIAIQQLGPYYGHTLWQAGDEVTVHSPMAMLYHQSLKIKTVTWMQDSTSGTQTVLNLCLPQGLNGPPVVMPAADKALSDMEATARAGVM